MAEIATIARPYAEALFQASAADLENTAWWLDSLGSVAANEQVQQFAANPKVTSEQLFGLVTEIAKVPLPPHGVNFLRTVIENDRLSALPEIARQFRELKNAQGGSSDAVVYSAFPIAPAQLGEVTKLLERRFGRKLNVSVQEEPDLIGGIRVAVGDEVLDTSVRARLEQMKVALTA